MTYQILAFLLFQVGTTQSALSPDELHREGILYAEAGKLEESESALRHALSLRQKALGPRHPDVGVTLKELGLVLDVEAAQLELRANSIQEIRRHTVDIRAPKR